MFLASSDGRFVTKQLLYSVRFNNNNNNNNNNNGRLTYDQKLLETSLIWCCCCFFDVNMHPINLIYRTEPYPDKLEINDEQLEVR